MPPAYRDYKIVQLTGWTFEEIDAADAVRLEWLLQVAGAVEQHEREQRRDHQPPL